MSLATPAAAAVDAKSALVELLSAALKSVAPEATGVTITLERPKQAAHGDFSCNVAMQLAKALRAKPRDIADKLLAALPASALLEKADIAGAGFINLFLRQSFKQAVINQILTSGARFGDSAVGAHQKVQVEFVSANPTGPLHVGHGRGAAYGASLANVLAAAGYTVAREYYVNDAGRQMDILALSTWLRYLEQHGDVVPFPPNAYQGDYVREMAQQLPRATYQRSAVEVLRDVLPLPDATLQDDAAKAAREIHLDAKRMLLTGNLIDGVTAEKWGLVSESVPGKQLDAAVDALADRIASIPSGMLTMQKMVVNESIERMGLLASQTLATLFDGITRHNPEGMWFRRYSQVHGFKAAVEWRDSGRPIPEGDAARAVIAELDELIAGMPKPAA